MTGMHYSGGALSVDAEPKTFREVAAAIAQHVGLVLTSTYQRREEHVGNTIKVRAPENPYRRGVGDEVDLGAYSVEEGRATLGVRRSDTSEGPGLSAKDIDVIARQHYRDGYAAAERDGRPLLDVARGRQAEAFDEGYAEGKMEQAVALARDVRARVLDVHFTLMNAERGPKAKMAERLEAVREQVDALREFVEAVKNDPSLQLYAIVPDAR